VLWAFAVAELTTILCSKTTHKNSSIKDNLQRTTVDVVLGTVKHDTDRMM
jgi:hypothetical protein